MAPHLAKPDTHSVNPPHTPGDIDVLCGAASKINLKDGEYISGGTNAGQDEDCNICFRKLTVTREVGYTHVGRHSSMGLTRLFHTEGKLAVRHQSRSKCSHWCIILTPRLSSLIRLRVRLINL